MSKLAILNDTHFGVKNGSQIFLDYSSKFFSEVFFPYCIENGIKHVLHAGDYFDHRKFVNYKVMQHSYDAFISKLYEHDMTMDIICGNHDVYYKNTNSLNSLQQVLGQYSDRVHIHMDPIDKDFDGLSIGFLPWMTQDNYDECTKFIATSKSSILLSHLELQGFLMGKGLPVASHGLASNLFSRYEMVLSGHYHTKSTQGNIHYLGTQMELTWSDAGDTKYFHVLDTETRELTPVRNKYLLFRRIRYNDTETEAITKDEIHGSYVKVVVVSKKDLYEFDKFIDRLQSYEPFEVKIVETYDEYTGENVNDDDVSTTDTPTLLNTYVDSIETDLDSDKLKTMLQELFVEAQQIESI
jgi:DNA repair exonuclease SbcCD nuclease subunit